jgi:hypothetical protein
MMTRGKIYVLVGLLGMVGCSGGPTNTVKTKEDADKILSAVGTAMGLVPLDGQVACPDGGTVSGKVTLGVDILKGEASTTNSYSFKGCVIQGITLDGALDRVSKTGGGGSSLTSSGHVDTSLGSCIIELAGASLSTTQTGTVCGFDTVL